MIKQTTVMGMHRNSYISSPFVTIEQHGIIGRHRDCVHRFFCKISLQEKSNWIAFIKGVALQWEPDSWHVILMCTSLTLLHTPVFPAALLSWNIPPLLNLHHCHKEIIFYLRYGLPVLIKCNGIRQSVGKITARKMSSRDCSQKFIA